MESHEKQDVLSIWVGTLEYPSYENFRDDWIEEKYDRHNPDAIVLSKFMNTYQTGWYDHDFQDVHFVKDPVSLGDLIKDCSYFESYENEVLEVAKNQGIDRCNTIIIVFNFEYPKSKAKALEKLPLKFLGTFPYVVTFSEEFEKILRMKTGDNEPK